MRAAVELRTPKTARMILFSSLALAFVGIVWAHFAILDEVKRGQGKVVPSQQVQVVQTLEGGLVSEILVREGAIVQAGQPLIRIDDTNFAAQFGEIRERRASMGARVARLQTQAAGGTELVFSEDLHRDAPRAIDAEKSVFEAQQRKLSQDILVLKSQLAQKQQETAEARAQEAKINSTLLLLAAKWS